MNDRDPIWRPSQDRIDQANLTRFQAHAARCGAPAGGYPQLWQWSVDEPAAFEDHLIVDHLKQLLAGVPVQQPIYDYATHSRAPVRRTVNPLPRPGPAPTPTPGSKRLCSSSATASAGFTNTPSLNP